MHYKNGKEIFPSELLLKLQEYVQGNLVYIPKKENVKAGWGENSGARVVIKNRNQEIYKAHMEGMQTGELAASFCLSEDSIRKILRAEAKQNTGIGGKKPL